MKFTYEVPGILIDNTKGEAIYELVTKTSMSLGVSGSILVSNGLDTYVVTPLSDITGNLVHHVVPQYPLSVDETVLSSPVISLTGKVPVNKGGTGLDYSTANKILAGGPLSSYRFIEIEGADIIRVTTDSNTGNITINSNLFDAAYPKSTFMASNPNFSSAIGFRTIISNDLPDILTNKTLVGATSGSHTGSFSGSYIGDFSGDASGLTNLSSSQFTDFVGDIYNHLSGGDGISLERDGDTIVITSSAGNGGMAAVYTIGSITGSGVVGDEVRLKDDIQVSTITASNALFSGNITVNGTASIALLNTVNQQSLQVGDKYITIMTGASDHIELDGSGILYGSGSTDPTTGVQGSAAHIIFRGIGPSSDYLEIYPGLKVSGSLTVTDSTTFTQITSSNFYGDGNKLYNIGNGFSLPLTTDYFQDTNSDSVITLTDLPVGSLVSVGTNYIEKSDKTNSILSNVIGCVKKSFNPLDSTLAYIFISTSGLEKVKVNNTYDRGTVLYAGNNGVAVQYSELSSGDYATQIGYVLGNYDNVYNTIDVVLQIRVFGQLA